MPDRITNTINVEGSDEPVCRPTVINMYGEDLSSLPKWWKSWEVSNRRPISLYAKKVQYVDFCSMKPNAN